MTHPLTTGELAPERLAQAWPLVREIADGVSLESWCAFAQAMLQPIDPTANRRGILVVERKRTIRGLVTYETIDDLARGRLLLLRNAVVLDLALRKPIAVSLHNSSVDIAHQAQCGGLCLEVVPQMAWIGAVWQDQSAGGGTLPVSVVDVVPPVAEPRRGEVQTLSG